MKEVFKTVADAVQAVPGVRWVDFDLGQLDTGPNPPVSWPCVLISFQDAAFQNMAEGAQLAEMVLILRVGFKVRERTHSKAETTYRDDGLAHIDLMNAIHAALDGLAGDTFKDLRRRGWATEPRADWRVYRLTYSCIYYDVPVSEYIPFPDSVEDDEGNPVAVLPSTLCWDIEYEQP